MSNPWGKIGAWADEGERAEAEEREAAEAAAAAQTTASVGAGAGDSRSFPSLREAAGTKQKKKTKMSLQEFYGSSSSVRQEVGLTPSEMLRLPTGPKERSADEMQYGRIGGGFSSYGARSSGPPPSRNRDRDMDGDNSWANNRRSYGGFEDDRRGPPSRVSDFDQPSRADEVDNWALGKKPLPSLDSRGPTRNSSLGGDGGGFGGGFSRADEVDNWAATKKSIPQRSSNFGSGFRDSRVENDRWIRGGMGDGDQGRRKLILDPPRREESVVQVVKSNKPNPFGAARPREEVLTEKGLDWKKLDAEIEAKKTSRPTSSHSSRPGSAHSRESEGPALHGTEGAVKPRPKVNPFGDAKPREVLLEEKGLDWRKIDLELEHRSVERPKTEVEKNLREDIEHLKKELEIESASNLDKGALQGSGEGKTSLHELILQKERDLELLILELNNKVRFGQKAIDRPGSAAGRVASYTERQIERPGSGAGRAGGYPERPPSQSGASDESRGVQFMERPQSRGTRDAWTRQGDDRRAFQSGRDRRFLGDRDVDRSRSREGW
ncbi:unnamed protein product [Ilex paraguariensis]|uniref:Eukaryotic translation initiation factor 4B2 n=1 Tax=Ilex paraguariensis TaxID=185542 RepID=A0ABC8U8N0_9AQUA